MLQLKISGGEYFDQKTNMFHTYSDQILTLEHSLVSISKWESKWKKSYISSRDKTTKEVKDYIRCMTITQNVNPIIYKVLTPDHYKQIQKYIEDPMTATTFREEQNRPAPRKTITAEEIYYEMIQFGIPFECQKWHLNRLITLIRVCQEKEKQRQRSSKRRPGLTSDQLRSRSELNDLRRAAANSKG